MKLQPAHLITVQIARHECGWFVATSEDCPGLYLADPSRERVVELIPEGIEVHYEARDRIVVKAIPLTRPAGPATGVDSQLSFAAIPAASVGLPRSA